MTPSCIERAVLDAVTTFQLTQGCAVRTVYLAPADWTQLSDEIYEKYFYRDVGDTLLMAGLYVARAENLKPGAAILRPVRGKSKRAWFWSA